jgi:RNA polymerase subunit RPABC4/transcription elongation factor Spt4
MYARVPENLKIPLAQEIKKRRLQNSILYFPILVLIFSSLALLAIFVKGHELFSLLEGLTEHNPITDVSPVILVGVVIGAVSIFIFVILWMVYSKEAIQEYFFCSKCNAVDSYENGYCPICRSPLSQKEWFIFTTAKDEQKIIESRGLRACFESPCIDPV